MILRLLIGLAAAGSVGGTVAAFALTTGNTNNTKNQENSNSVAKVIEKGEETNKREEAQEIQTELEQPAPELVSVEEQTANFEGVLVFSRETSSSGRGTVGPLIYKGEVFDNKEYEQKKEEWKKPDDEGDEEVSEEDPYAHIKVKLPFGKVKKTEQELKEYLNKLNEKIKTSSESTELKKLEKTLGEDKSEFTDNFGSKTYDALLKEIQKLNTTSSK